MHLKIFYLLFELKLELGTIGDRVYNKTLNMAWSNSQTAAQICLKFCTDVTWVDPNKFIKIECYTFHGMMGNFGQSFANS